MNDREEKLVGKKIIKLQMTSQTKKKPIKIKVLKVLM
jgi:hypothetical protein